MSPPKVYELIRPRSQRTTKAIAMVSSIMLLLFAMQNRTSSGPLPPNEKLRALCSRTPLSRGWFCKKRASNGIADSSGAGRRYASRVSMGRSGAKRMYAAAQIKLASRPILSWDRVSPTWWHESSCPEVA